MWLSSCLRVTSHQAFGNSGKRSPIVSLSDNSPSLTSESATAPLKALAALAMRMRSSILIGLPVRTLATPKVCTSRCWPRWTTAMTPGGPPSIATRSLSARSSAASALLTFSLPKATLPPRYGTETTAVAKAVCLKKRLLLMIVALPSGRCDRSSVAILGFPSLCVGLGGVAPPHSPYHGAIQGSFALAHPFCRYTTVHLLLPSCRMLMEKRCHQVLFECLPLRLLDCLLPRTSEKPHSTTLGEYRSEPVRRGRVGAERGGCVVG